jgi:hypothetical protein
MIRKTILLVALIAITVASNCQDLPAYSENRNEINLGYFNAFELNAIGDLGIGYKRANDKGAFRIGMGMDLGMYESDYETHQANSTGYGVSPRIGYEFHQWYNRIRLHYGADVVGTFRKSSYEDTYDDPANDRYSNTKSYSAGIRPVLGLTVYLSKSISIATETYMDISFSKSTTERDYNGNTTTEVSRGINAGLGPLGIVSVNFHF